MIKRSALAMPLVPQDVMNNNLKFLFAATAAFSSIVAMQASPSAELMPSPETAVIFNGPNCKTFKKPLLRAVWDEKSDQVEALLEKGADVNEYESSDLKSSCHLSSLHLAVYRQNLPIVKLLVSKGADVKARDGMGQDTPLVMAIAVRNTEIIMIWFTRIPDLQIASNKLKL